MPVTRLIALNGTGGAFVNILSNDSLQPYCIS